MSAIEILKVKTGGDEVEDYRKLRAMLWPMPEEENQREASEILAAAEKWAVFLARGESGRPLGFVEVRLREFAEGASSSPVGFLEGWFVVLEARRGGIGRSLVEAGEDWARSRGCTEMASNTEIERNESIEAHKRLGYVEVERDVCFLKKLS